MNRQQRLTSICCRILVVIFLLVNSSGDALNCSSSKSAHKNIKSLRTDTLINKQEAFQFLIFVFTVNIDCVFYSLYPPLVCVYVCVCVRTLLQCACVGGGVSSDDVQDAQQLQDVLDPACVLAAARLRLCHLPGHAQDLTALIGCDRARAQTTRATPDTDTVFT